MHFTLYFQPLRFPGTNMRRPEEDPPKVGSHSVGLLVPGTIPSLMTVTEPLNEDVDLYEALKSMERQIDQELSGIVVSSGVSAWALSKFTEKMNPVPILFLHPFDENKAPLAHKIRDIYKDVWENDVLLLETPTGTGKSIVMPTVMKWIAQKVAEEGQNNVFPAWTKDTSWKVIHLTPTSDQAIQNADYVRSLYDKMQDKVNVRSYTSAVNSKSGMMHRQWDSRTHYLYATMFYGEHALNGPLLGIVVDEVHEWTPDLVRLLCFIRRRMDWNWNRTVFRLVLLSASLKDPIRDELIKYFREVGLNVKNVRNTANSPFLIREVFSDDANDEVMRKVIGNRTQEDLSLSEVNHSGDPAWKEIKNRSIAVQEQLLLKEERTQQRSTLSGMISFGPGKAEVNNLRSGLTKTAGWKGVNGGYKMSIDLFKVSGKERADMEFLTKQFKHKDHVRVIHSTPLLAHGVTLPGVKFVIDDGLIKMPCKYSHAGALHLETRFQDGSLYEQKRGRVGRLSPGMYYNVLSRERVEQMKKKDLTIERFDRAFRTNHLPKFIENSKSMIAYPAESTMTELCKEMLFTGFLQKRKEDDERDDYKGFQATPYACVLGRGFPGTTLGHADFLVRCAAFGIGLHGLIFIASCGVEHRAVRHATSTEEGVGRDHGQLAMNKWTETMYDVSGSSDFETVTEIALNLFFHEAGAASIPDEFEKIKIKDLDDYIDNDGLNHLSRLIMINYSGMRSLEVVPVDNVAYFRGQLFSNYIYSYNADKSAMIYRLKYNQKLIFRACLAMSFGSRVLYKDEDVQRKIGQRIMYVLGGAHSPIVSQFRLVQGESAVKDSFKLAIYDVIVRRADTESFLTGMLHGVTAMEFVLFGNVMGASQDEVVADTQDVLKIATNTCHFYVKFIEKETMERVMLFRKYMQQLPLAKLLGKESGKMYIEKMKKMMMSLLDVNVLSSGTLFALFPETNIPDVWNSEDVERLKTYAEVQKKKDAMRLSRRPSDSGTEVVFDYPPSSASASGMNITSASTSSHSQGTAASGTTSDPNLADTQDTKTDKSSAAEKNDNN